MVEGSVLDREVFSVLLWQIRWSLCVICYSSKRFLIQVSNPVRAAYCIDSVHPWSGTKAYKPLTRGENATTECHCSKGRNMLVRYLWNDSYWYFFMAENLWQVSVCHEGAKTSFATCKVTDWIWFCLMVYFTQYKTNQLCNPFKTWHSLTLAMPLCVTQSFSEITHCWHTITQYIHWGGIATYSFFK